MTYTDEQLKRTLAKMLPAKLTAVTTWKITVLWIDKNRAVLDTELLSICHEIEGGLDDDQSKRYCWKLQDGFLPETKTAQWLGVHADWDKRTIALAQVLGVEVEK